MDTITASALVRNDRVVVDSDEMPYLVDSVNDLSDGAVRVTFSSGDVVDYAAGVQVSIID